MFELVPGRPGTQRISVTAWADGTYLGELAVDVTAAHDSRAGRDRDMLTEINTGHTDGEVSLLVHRDHDAGSYRFEFIDADLPHEVHARLLYEPGPGIEKLVRDLETLAEGHGGYTVAQTRDYLINAGLELWEQLVPKDLRDQFWERQDRIRQLTIVTDNDVIPWELLYPQDQGHDAGFLVEQFSVTRAVFGRRRTRALRLHPARFVLPQSSPPEARGEIDALRNLLDPGQPDKEIIAELTPLLDLIRREDFGLLHFACHNRFDPQDGSSILLDSPFVPRLMTTAASSRALDQSTPVVFINACRSAGRAPAYSRLDGWADKFMQAGAAAFVGSLWAVRDTTAHEFAAEFYKNLKAGESLGTAAMSARKEIANNLADPTWLAYAIYGDPNAKITNAITLTQDYWL